MADLSDIEAARAKRDGPPKPKPKRLRVAWGDVVSDVAARVLEGRMNADVEELVRYNAAQTPGETP